MTALSPTRFGDILNKSGYGLVQAYSALNYGGGCTDGGIRDVHLTSRGIRVQKYHAKPK
jgi:hypothetical protein